MLLGYLEYIALLFLPGMALIELFRFGMGLSLAEKLGLVFGLSISLDTLLLVVLTSGLQMGPLPLRGIQPSTLQALIGVSVALILLPLIARRRSYFYSKIGRTDIFVIGLTLVQALLITIHFSEYPIFPQFNSADFEQHVMITNSIVAGASSIPQGILYYGVHLLMGSAVVLTGEEPLIVTQRAVAILAVFSPLLLYAAVSSLGVPRRVAQIYTLVYVGAGYIWYGSVFNAGLYANFFGLLSIFFLIVGFSQFVKSPKSIAGWLTYLLAIGCSYFSHYSTLTVLPSLIAVPILTLLFTRKLNRAETIGAALPILGVIGVVAVRPDVISFLGSLLNTQPTTNITFETPLSAALGSVPVLKFIAAEISIDSATIVLLLMALVGAYFVLRERRGLVWVPLVWLLTLLVAAPLGDAAWRFAYVALVPLTIIAAWGIGAIEFARKTTGRRKRFRGGASLSERSRLVLISAVLILILAGSWSYLIISDAISNGQQNSTAEQSVYDSIQWIKANTPSDSRVLAVTDWRYTFTLLLTGRLSAYSPLITPNDTYTQFKTASDLYVAVTKITTVVVPPDDPTLNPLITYPSDSRFKLVYQNQDVYLYKLLPSAGQKSG